MGYKDVVSSEDRRCGLLRGSFMADSADIAYENEQFSMSIRLKNRIRNRLPETGFCYNCGEPVKTGLFCDGDCREDYEKRERFGQINTDNV